MGKGDRKTRRGKIVKGSYGVSRPKRPSKSKASNNGEKKVRPKTTTEAKSPAKQRARKPAAEAKPKAAEVKQAEVTGEKGSATAKKTPAKKPTTGKTTKTASKSTKTAAKEKKSEK